MEEKELEGPACRQGHTGPHRAAGQPPTPRVHEASLRVTFWRCFCQQIPDGQTQDLRGGAYQEKIKGRKSSKDKSELEPTACILKVVV